MIQPYLLPARTGTPPAVPDLELTLGPHAHIRFDPDVPTYAADRRAVVAASTIYCILGVLLDPPGNHLAGYVGKTEALYSGPTGTGRPGSSWNHWVSAQRALDPTGMALVTTTGLNSDQLALLEARIITRLSTDLGSIALTNTHTSAETAAARLTKDSLHTTVALGDQIAHTIWTHGYGHTTNPWPSPAANQREAAVRVVLRISQAERRGLTTLDVVRHLEKLGYHSNGRTRARSVRRDLLVREQASRCPRINYLHLDDDRPLYFAPTLTATDATNGYYRRHPQARRTATPGLGS